MRNVVLGIVAASALVAVTAIPGFAGPNCGLVKKDLQMGRTPDDIAERMMVPVEEVKKCQEEGAAAAPAAPAAGGAANDEAAPAEDSHEGHGH